MHTCEPCFRLRSLRSELLWLSGERDTARALLNPLAEKLRVLRAEKKRTGDDGDTAACCR